MFIAGMALLSVFFGSSTVHAARPDTTVCDGLAGNAFGICTAAVSSGCALNGRNEGSKHCDRLSSNFTRKTGDDPVWLAPEPAPTPVTPPSDGIDWSGG
jgi:hypothetical protein